MANTKQQFSTQQEALQSAIERTGEWRTIQDNTKTLRNYAFYAHPLAQHIKLTRVTSIPSYYAFQYCRELESLEFTQKVNFPVYSETNAGERIFYNCPKLSHLILRNSQKSTITSNQYSMNVFDGSAIAYKNGAIYVPENLLESYKNDDYWGYRYIIVPITEPFQLLETFDTITDTWDIIIQNCRVATENNQSPISKYKIGDSKVFYDLNGNPFYAELVAKFTDTDSNTNKKVPTTWIIRELYPNNRVFSSNNSHNWSNSTIRSYLNNIDTGVFSMIENTNLKNNIKTVNKISYNLDGSQTTSQDKLWLPSIREIFGNADFETQGPEYYNSFFKARGIYGRIKYITLSGFTNLNLGQSYNYWTRTRVNRSISSNAVRIINTSGAQTYTNRDNTCPFCFGFCI